MPSLAEAAMGLTGDLNLFRIHWNYFESGAVQEQIELPSGMFARGGIATREKLRAE